MDSAARARERRRRGHEGNLAGNRPLGRVEVPATLDGGGALMVGRTLFVGRSARTNEAGIRQLGDLAVPPGYLSESLKAEAALTCRSLLFRRQEGPGPRFVANPRVPFVPLTR